MTSDISMKNTKKELLEIIEKMQRKVTEKEKSTLNPEKVKSETKTKETIIKAEEVTCSDMTRQIHDLKVSINQELSILAEKIEEEAKKHIIIQESINLKQAELEEIYGIETQAASLAAIIESNNQVKQKFTAEMALQREKLEKEINETRTSWENEKRKYKETKLEEKENTEKNRKREEDEYTYNLQRSRSMEENEYADQLAILEKEIATKKDNIEKHVQEKTTTLKEREQTILQRETTMNQLEITVESFPKELETAVNYAVKRKEKELTTSFEQEKALLTKGFEGEQKVLEAKLSALESLVTGQASQIEKLINQQEKAYQQVQDIAAKAVTGATERPQSITVKSVEKDS